MSALRKRSKGKLKEVVKEPEVEESASEPEPEDSDEDDEEIDQEEEDSGQSEPEEEDDEAAAKKRTEIRKELSNMTFEELAALRDKLGSKVWDEAMFGKSGNQRSTLSSSSKKIKVFQRTNKNRPREVSSKIRVPKVRVVTQTQKKRARDPRFENLCGDYDEKSWNARYQFIKDIQSNETKELKEKLTANELSKDKEKEARKHLQRIREKEKSDLLKQKEKEKSKLQKEENIQRLKEGKKPYFMKKSTKKYVDLVEKYEQLKSTGGLEKYLKKKRKKNASRDKKTMKFN